MSSSSQLKDLKIMRKKILDDSDYSDLEKENKEINTQLIDHLNKKFDSEVAYNLDDYFPGEIPGWLSTGSTLLDMVISNKPDAPGGIPVRRITTITGDSGTGKSLLAYMMLKSCKDQGGIPVLIDTEGAADIDFLEMLGLEPKKNLIYVQVDSIEDVFKAIEETIKKIRETNKDKLCTIVWDSIAGTSVKQELENEFGGHVMGLHARMIGQGLRKIVRYIAQQNVALIFLNQLRYKMNSSPFQDPFTEPGGLAAPFFSSVRLRLYSAGKIKHDKLGIVGVGIKAKVIKNRLGPPFREAELKMYFDRGIIDEETWLDVMLELEIVEKLSTQKSAIKFDGETIEFKNRDFVEWIRLPENKKLRDHMQKEIKKVLYIDQSNIKINAETTTIEALQADENI